MEGINSKYITYLHEKGLMQSCKISIKVFHVYLLFNHVQDWYQPSTMNLSISSLLPLKYSFTVVFSSSNFNILPHVFIMCKC